MKIKYVTIILILSLFVVSSVHAQQFTSPVYVKSLCASTATVACGTDRSLNDGKYYLAYCRFSPLYVLLGSQIGSSTHYRMWVASDRVFGSFSECKKTCMDVNSSNSNSYFGVINSPVDAQRGFIMCIHDPEFLMPELGRLNVIYPRQTTITAACIADDGIYSCSASGIRAAVWGQSACDDAQGCTGKPCKDIKLYLCGKPASDTEELVEENEAYAATLPASSEPTTDYTTVQTSDDYTTSDWQTTTDALVQYPQDTYGNDYPVYSGPLEQQETYQETYQDYVETSPPQTCDWWNVYCYFINIW
jgi:hypothetical protein